MQWADIVFAQEVVYAVVYSALLLLLLLLLLLHAMSGASDSTAHRMTAHVVVFSSFTFASASACSLSFLPPGKQMVRKKYMGFQHTVHQHFFFAFFWRGGGASFFGDIVLVKSVFFFYSFLFAF